MSYSKTLLWFKPWSSKTKTAAGLTVMLSLTSKHNLKCEFNDTMAVQICLFLSLFKIYLFIPTETNLKKGTYVNYLLRYKDGSQLQVLNAFLILINLTAINC